MTFAVTKPITAAPWENPPSTMLVLGQFAACGLDIRARVPDADQGGGEVGGGGVVDRIYLDRLCADSRAQRVHECLSCWTNTGILGGAAREHHLEVGAGLRGRGRNGCAQGRPTCCCSNEYSGVACPHRAMLTYRDDGGNPKNQQRMNAG